MAAFGRYCGIDYSGAGTPASGLPGLRLFLADGDAPPVEVCPARGRSRYWSRRGLADWLAGALAEATPALVGIDHAFSFPEAYFAHHGLERDWDAFLDDFAGHWPTDRADVTVDAVRRGQCGAGPYRGGDARWRRHCERRAGGAKSVFHFDVPGSVAKSTHAGLPLLRALRRAAGNRAGFWPFDGWWPPAGRSLVAEVYPALWRTGPPAHGRTPDQEDARTVALRLQAGDRGGELAHWLTPGIGPEAAAHAAYEGWILGVV